MSKGKIHFDTKVQKRDMDNTYWGKVKLDRTTFRCHLVTTFTKIFVNTKNNSIKYIPLAYFKNNLTLYSFILYMPKHILHIVWVTSTTLVKFFTNSVINNRLFSLFAFHSL